MIAIFGRIFYTNKQQERTDHYGRAFLSLNWLTGEGLSFITKKEDENVGRKMKHNKGNDINGWVVVDKPRGMGSTDVVRKLKFFLKPKKIGHAGTLDPFATGVLPVALGEATKLLPFVTD